MKRWIASSLILLLLGLAVAGCGVSQSGSPVPSESPGTGDTPSQPEGEPKEITLFHFKVNIEKEIQELLDLYNETHPNVIVKQEAIGGSTDWIALLKTRFAAGNGPDIFVVDGISQLNLWKDRLVDLSDEPWVERAYDFAKADMTVDGKLMAMPFNIEGYGFIYNKDIFNELNLGVPKTLTELKAAAQTIKDAGYIPFSTGFGEWWVIGMHLVNMPFAHAADPDGFIAGLNDGTAQIPGTESFLQFRDLLDTLIEFGDPNPLTSDYNSQVSLFADGKVAMIQQGNWQEPTIFQINPDINMGLLPIPLSDDPAMDALPMGVPQNFVINKDSKAIEEAKDFLNWLVTDETAVRYYTDQFAYVPAFDHISSDSLGPLSQDLNRYSNAGNTLPWMFSKFPDGIYNRFASILQGYVGKQYDYDETLVRMQQAWDELK